jgi:hypothetical protein
MMAGMIIAALTISMVLFMQILKGGEAACTHDLIPSEKLQFSDSCAVEYQCQKCGASVQGRT